jgi:hypothetical protein
VLVCEYIQFRAVKSQAYPVDRVKNYNSTGSDEDLRRRHGLRLVYTTAFATTDLARGKKSPSLRAIVRLAGALKTRGSEILKRVEAGGGG